MSKTWKFTPLRNVEVTGKQPVNGGHWILVIISKGIDTWMFNTPIPTKEHALVVVNRIKKAGSIHTKYWTEIQKELKLI